MSIKLMSAAWDIPPKTLPKGCKFLLIALCDNANDQGVCYPSIEYLANKCEMCVRTVQNHVQWLAEHGYLSAEERKGRSTVYTIDYAALLHPPLAQQAEKAVKAELVSSHPRKICTPANFSKTPAKFAPTPANFSKTPAKFAPITITNHHLTTTEPLAPEISPQTEGAAVVVDVKHLENLPWPARFTAGQRESGGRLLCSLPFAQAEACVRLLAQAMTCKTVPKPLGYLATLAERAREGTLDVSGLEASPKLPVEAVPASAAHRSWQEVKAEQGHVSAAERAAEAAHLKRLQALGVGL